MHNTYAHKICREWIKEFCYKEESDNAEFWRIVADQFGKRQKVITKQQIEHAIGDCMTKIHEANVILKSDVTGILKDNMIKLKKDSLYLLDALGKLK